MKTYLPKVNLDQRKWHVIDANGAVLGRVAAQVADILRGKNKPVFTPHLDAGDFVVVVNAEKVRVTGKKETDKTYMSYSGWRGGEKYRTVAQIRARRPEDLIHHIGEDTLVGWAWAPGYGRAPAPGTQKEAGALVEAWVKIGAICPAN